MAVQATWVPVWAATWVPVQATWVPVWAATWVPVRAATWVLVLAQATGGPAWAAVWVSVLLLVLVAAPVGAAPLVRALVATCAVLS